MVVCGIDFLVPKHAEHEYDVIFRINAHYTPLVALLVTYGGENF